MGSADPAKIESNTEQTGVFELVGDCNIRTIAEIAATLQQRAGDLAIDARGLTAIDVAGLQLLVSARKSRAANGCAMRIAAEAEGALDLAVQRAGLEPMFRDVLVSELP